MRAIERNLSRLLLAGALAALLAGTGTAVAAPPSPTPFAGESPAAQLADTELLQAEAGADTLAPGEFEWLPGWDQDTGAPVMVMVSLREQRAYVYRDGRRIAVTTVSTGRPGHETPTGVFEIIEKQRVHYSNLYEDPRSGRPAPMPWMQRLTMTGLSLHAGHVRAQPASHGCVRLPPKFAQQLYSLTERGGIVVISEDGSMEALARAGVGSQLALLIGITNSLRKIADVFVPDAPAAGDISAAAEPGDAREGAFSP